MVAYSFKPQFEAPIVARTKCQTVRAHRARHAFPGEPIQIYTGMRTRNCRKLLTPDPICVDVRDVLIFFEPNTRHIIARIDVAGVQLTLSQAYDFARADGFGVGVFALRRMGTFWLETHGSGMFEGVVIRWRDA